MLRREVMGQFDSDGSGEINYRKFCELVMGSTQDTSTSLTTSVSGRVGHVSADSGNNEMMLRRKIRMSFKDISNVFRDLDKNKSWVLPGRQVQQILARYDIDMTTEQFGAACTKLKCTSTGMVPYKEFLGLFKHDADPGADTTASTAIVRGVSATRAITMIREKVMEKLEGGPDSLRRAFRYFDTDGDGSISLDEFKDHLRKRMNLAFEERTLREVMGQVGLTRPAACRMDLPHCKPHDNGAGLFGSEYSPQITRPVLTSHCQLTAAGRCLLQFDDTGDGEINYRKFCELVMGSTVRHCLC